MANKQPLKLSDISITTWVKEHKIKTDQGKDLYFSGDRKFLFAPFSDLSEKQVSLKAAQIGYSTISIVKAVWCAAKFGLSIIYTFPTTDLMQKYVQGKINPLIDANPIMKKMVAGTNNLYQKRVGNANIIFSGAEKESQAIAFSADVLVHDELDNSNAKIVKQFKARTQASQFRWEWLFSHPSLPEQGVHEAWLKSDQKHWFITCECGHKQYLSWPESFDIPNNKYICKECKEEITDEMRQKGKWYPKYEISKERPYSGYWIPLMIAPWVKAEEIIEYSKGDQYTFYTRVLGLPYVSGGDKVTAQEILKNCTNAINYQEGRIVIGVDTGLPIYYTVGNAQGLFFYGNCKTYDEIEKMMLRWPKSIVVADQGGDLIGIRQLREKYPGRVFLCHYRRDRKTMSLIKWGEGEEFGNVIVDRNRMMQLMIDEFRDTKIPLNGTPDDWYQFALHFTHIYRVAVENSLGVLEYKWERSDADHNVHSTLYCRVGLSRFSEDGEVFLGNRKPIYQIGPEISEDMTIIYNPNDKYQYAESYHDDWRN